MFRVRHRGERQGGISTMLSLLLIVLGDFFVVILLFLIFNYTLHSIVFCIGFRYTT